MIGDIIIANVIASGCLVVLIYLLDINEKEPVWALVKIYIFSILLTFIFGKAKMFLYHRFDLQFSVLFECYIIAGVFEELLKISIIFLCVYHLKSFNEVSDGIVYYLIVAAGFSVLENVGYSYRFVIHPYLHGLQTGDMHPYRDALEKIVLFRAVSGHIFINIVSGFFLGLAKVRHRFWFVILGLILSIFIHGTWNYMAHIGQLVPFAALVLIVNIALFVVAIRMSFYSKFIIRLKERIQEQILEAQQNTIREDLIALMEMVRDRIGSLRRMEGRTLKVQAKMITQTLPSKISTVTFEGKDGLIDRFLKINLILSQNIKKRGGWHLTGIFLRFFISGFLLLIFLMNLM